MLYSRIIYHKFNVTTNYWELKKSETILLLFLFCRVRTLFMWKLWVSWSLRSLTLCVLEGKGRIDLGGALKETHPEVGLGFGKCWVSSLRGESVEVVADPLVDSWTSGCWEEREEIQFFQSMQRSEPLPKQPLRWDWLPGSWELGWGAPDRLFRELCQMPPAPRQVCRESLKILQVPLM